MIDTTLEWNAHQLAVLFGTRVSEVYPGTTQPRTIPWAATFERMLREDNLTPEEILVAMYWAFKHPHFRKRIRSAIVFRRYFPCLAADAKKYWRSCDPN